MKRIISILSVLVFLLGMAVCGSADEDQIPKNTGNTEPVMEDTTVTQIENKQVDQPMSQKLNLSLCGRVDTLTAPQVLELYEKITGDTVISRCRH